MFVCAKEKIKFLCFVDQFVTYHSNDKQDLYKLSLGCENALFELARLYKHEMQKIHLLANKTKYS